MHNIIVERYSKAFFQLCLKEQLEERIYANVVHLLKVFSQHSKLASFFKNPIVSRNKKVKILYALTAQLEKKLLHFLLFATQKGRASLVKEMLLAFVERYKYYQKTKVAYVTSAVVLSKPNEDLLKGFIKKLGNYREVALVVKVDPTILGGYILQLGDHRLDASLQTKLKQLKKYWKEEKSHF